MIRYFEESTPCKMLLGKRRWKIKVRFIISYIIQIEQFYTLNTKVLFAMHTPKQEQVCSHKTSFGFILDYFFVLKISVWGHFFEINFKWTLTVAYTEENCHKKYFVDLYLDFRKIRNYGLGNQRPYSESIKKTQEYNHRSRQIISEKRPIL